jgi:hypothetical protein
MKKILFIAVLLSGNFTYSQLPKNVLFLGNSYTDVNNLPQLIADLAASAGDNLSFDSNTPGGYTFNGHSTNATSLQKIQAGNWDFVVLQEQSQLPSLSIGQVQTDCFPYATILDSIIREYNSCAETMFYMTWGRETGDAQNCSSWPPVCTYNGMDSLLRLRYEQMAIDNQAVLSPVGALWHYIRQNNPSLQLYASDGSHPSLAGSYAAACSFYSTIFRKDPTLITDDYGLSTMDALFIRNAAKIVVFESLLNWHVGAYDPMASFTMIENFLAVMFFNQSTNACNYLWDFGDGTTSTVSDPVHIFQQVNTTFTITLTAECCGYSDTATGTFIVFVGLEENKMLNLQINPNPAKDFINVQIENTDQIYLTNLQGETIQVPILKIGESYKLDISQLSKGLYFIKAMKESKVYSGKIIKQ